MNTLHKKIIIGGLAVAIGVATFAPAAVAESHRRVPARAGVLKVREAFQKKMDKSNLQEARTRFQEARERLGDNNNFERQKQFLLRAIDSLIKHAELLKERVTNLPVIDDELEARIIAEIDRDIAKLTELQEKTNSATTIEELARIKEELASHRKNAYNTKVRGLVLLAHIGVYEHRVITTIEARADRIEQYLTDLSENGKDVTELKRLLSSAREKITTAKNILSDVKEIIQNNETDLDFLKRIQSKLKEVKMLIKDVYQIFREIVTQVKAIR
ncbi:MAG: hypothetical protein O2794_02065 [bacterium]|nr:hypothetical protein [bacterium]